jgi:phosphate acyltransferase
MKTVLSLDAMGGDNAPHAVLQGADLYLKKNPKVFFRIFGDKAILDVLIKNYESLKKNSEVIHSNFIITSDMKPSLALRNGRLSSMGMAISDVAVGNSKAVISAGNTGAYMALSKIVLKSFDCIDRPAIPAFIPSIKGQTLLLDLGANIECSPENLVQFAVMGSSYCKHLQNVENPSVGILNVGSEESKGNAVVREAFNLLKTMNNINFYGFVEGDNITQGPVDVVVTDGFSGNVALKAMEGVAKLFSQTLKDGMNSSFINKIGYLFSKSAFDYVRKKADPRLYNGAMFLGLKNIAIKSHGSADHIGFANALSVAIQLIEKNILTDLEKNLLEVA